MRFVYADPPYPGMSKRHYADHPDYAGEVDHDRLIQQLAAWKSLDGWALSTNEPSLRYVLNLCRIWNADVRVGAWVKPFASFKPGVNPAYAWEPVIFCGGRKLGRDVPTVRDWVSANITMETGTHGAKPIEFCYWVFDFLGMQPGDDLLDLYPGSGAVMRAWQAYSSQLNLFPREAA